MNLYETTEGRHSMTSFAGQLADAVKLHRALMPKALPRVKGFRFTQFHHRCGSHGGDFCDFRAVNDNLWVIVADIPGHGLEAALATTLLKYAFHETTANCDDVVGILEGMNAQLYEALPSGMLIPATLVGIAENRGFLRVGNAGLPAPIRLCAGSGGGYEYIRAAGSTLGLFSDPHLAAYGEQVVLMNAGDVVILASNGLSAIKDADGRSFVAEKLLDEVSHGKDRSSVIQALIDGAISFSDGQPFPDDVSILSITRQ